MITDRIFAVSTMTLALGFATAAADAAELFTLKSTTFADGKIIRRRLLTARPTCRTIRIASARTSRRNWWSNVPDGTKSLVLLMIDREGRGGAGVNHWVAYGIPASVTGFAEDEVSKQTDKYVGGKSTQGVAFYSGPRTPPNQMAHRYTFALIATDLAPTELAPGLTKRGSDCEAGSSRATAGPHQRSRRDGRTLRQSMA